MPRKGHIVKSSSLSPINERRMIPCACVVRRSDDKTRTPRTADATADAIRRHINGVSSILAIAEKKADEP